MTNQEIHGVYVTFTREGMWLQLDGENELMSSWLDILETYVKLFPDKVSREVLDMTLADLRYRDE